MQNQKQDDVRTRRPVVKVVKGKGKTNPAPAPCQFYWDM